MHLVQCEGYKANGDRCRYHGMADVRDGMYCCFHKTQSSYRTYLTRCRCRNCTNRTSFYFEQEGVAFYCQTHKHVSCGPAARASVLGSPAAPPGGTGAA